MIEGGDDGPTDVLARVLALESAVARAPTRDEVVRLCLELAQLRRQRLGDVEGALAALRRAVQVEPGHRLVLNRYAQLCASAERWAELVDVLELSARAARDDDERARVLAHRGDVLGKKLGRITEARGVYREVARLARDPALGAAAREAVERIDLILDPQRGAAPRERTFVGRVRGSQEPPPSLSERPSAGDERVEQLLRGARQALDGARLVDARAAIEQALAMRPRAEAALRLRHELLRAEGRWDELVRLLVAEADEAPTPSLAAARLAEAAELAAERLDDWVVATRALRRAAVYPGQEEISIARAAQLGVKFGRYAVARELRPELEPDARAVWLEQLASAASAAGDVRAATALRAVGFEDAVTDVAFFQARVRVLEAAGDVEGVEEVLLRRMRRVTDPDERRAMAWELAASSESRGRPRDAVAPLVELVVRARDDAEVAETLAAIERLAGAAGDRALYVRGLEAAAHRARGEVTRWLVAWARVLRDELLDAEGARAALARASRLGADVSDELARLGETLEATRVPPSVDDVTELDGPPLVTGVPEPRADGAPGPGPDDAARRATEPPDDEITRELEAPRFDDVEPSGEALVVGVEDDGGVGRGWAIGAAEVDPSWVDAAAPSGVQAAGEVELPHNDEATDARGAHNDEATDAREGGTDEVTDARGDEAAEAGERELQPAPERPDRGADVAPTPGLAPTSLVATTAGAWAVVARAERAEVAGVAAPMPASAARPDVDDELTLVTGEDDGGAAVEGARVEAAPTDARGADAPAAERRGSSEVIGDDAGTTADRGHGAAGAARPSTAPLAVSALDAPSAVEAGAGAVGSAAREGPGVDVEATRDVVDRARERARDELGAPEIPPTPEATPEVRSPEPDAPPEPDTSAAGPDVVRHTATEAGAALAEAAGVAASDAASAGRGPAARTPERGAEAEHRASEDGEVAPDDAAHARDVAPAGGGDEVSVDAAPSVEAEIDRPRSLGWPSDGATIGPDGVPAEAVAPAHDGAVVASVAVVARGAPVSEAAQGGAEVVAPVRAAAAHDAAGAHALGAASTSVDDRSTLDTQAAAPDSGALDTQAAAPELGALDTQAAAPDSGTLDTQVAAPERGALDTSAAAPEDRGAGQVPHRPPTAAGGEPEAGAGVDFVGSVPVIDGTSASPGGAAPAEAGLPATAEAAGGRAEAGEVAQVLLGGARAEVVGAAAPLALEEVHLDGVGVGDAPARPPRARSLSRARRSPHEITRELTPLPEELLEDTGDLGAVVPEVPEETTTDGGRVLPELDEITDASARRPAGLTTDAPPSAPATPEVVADGAPEELIPAALARRIEPLADALIAGADVAAARWLATGMHALTVSCVEVARTCFARGLEAARAEGSERAAVALVDAAWTQLDGAGSRATWAPWARPEVRPPELSSWARAARRVAELDGHAGRALAVRAAEIARILGEVDPLPLEEAWLEVAAAADPTAAVGVSTLYERAIERGDTAAARRWIERALEARDEGTRWWLRAADLELRDGRPTAAAAALERSMALAPLDVECARRLAELGVEAGEPGWLAAGLEGLLERYLWARTMGPATSVALVRCAVGGATPGDRLLAAVARERPGGAAPLDPALPEERRRLEQAFASGDVEALGRLLDPMSADGRRRLLLVLSPPFLLADLP